MKRIISCLLAVMLLIGLVPTTFAAVPNATITVEADKDAAMVNDEITFSVYIETDTPFTALQFDLAFPAGTEYIAGSGNIPDGLKAQMGFAEAAFTEATRRVTFGNDTAYTVSGRLKLAEFRGKITAENIDGYDINLTDASIYDADYNDLTYSIVPAHVDVTIPVNSINLNKSETSIVIGKSETLTAAVQPDNATNKTVSWRSSDASVASVKNGVVTAHKAGTATITATTEDGGRTASCKITVTPKPKPICNAPANVSAIYGQKLSDIALVNTSGNTAGVWSWKQPDTSVGDVGTKNFKAIFTPDNTADFAVVEDIDVSVTVEPKNITVQVADIANQTYTGSQLKPTVTVTGDGKTLSFNTDYTVEYGENVNVGSGSVTVKSKAGSNYIFTNTVKNFNIVAKAGQLTISGDLDVTYGTEVPDVIVNRNGSDGAVTIYYYTDEECTTGKMTTKPTAAGEYWVKAEMAASANYSNAESNVLGFTISRANINPVVSIAGWTYKDTANAPSVSGNTGSGTVTYKYKAKTADDSAYSVSVPTSAGEYTVKAEIAQTNNYNAGSATQNFTIAPKAITEAMAADVTNQPYTGTEIKPAPVIYDDAALVNNTDFTYDYENNTYVGNAAKVKIIGKGNYTGTITKTFTITTVDQTPAITAAASLTRGGATVDLKPLVINAMGEVDFTISGEANGCTIDNGILTSGTSNGTVKITVSISAKDVNGDNINEYNAFTGIDAITVTINDKATQAPLSITSATTVTCGQTLTLRAEGGSGDGAVTYTVSNGTGEATIEGNVLKAIKGGTVTVVAIKAEDSTYNSVSSAPLTITIEKIKVTIPAEDKTIYTYNGTEQIYQIAENSAYTIAGNKQTNANETGYTVTVTLNNTDTHVWEDDTIEAKNYIFAIKKATITVSAKNIDIYTGATAPVLGTSNYTVTGLADGETLKTAPTIEYETTPNTNAVGSVVIKIYGAKAPEGENYNDIVYINGKLSITKQSSGGGGVTRYTVKFDTNGGSNIANQTVKRNTVLITPEDPTKKGYLFGGWYTDKSLTAAYDFTEKVTKSFTLYAKWTEIVKEPDTTEWKNPFEDVKKNDWFYQDVKYVVENKLMNGVTETQFAPNDTLTRAMLVTVLYRNEGEPAVSKSLPFADIGMSAYYTNAVIWAKQNGIVNGVNESEFEPDTKITREQIAAIMHRYAKYKGYDVSVGENTNIFSYDDAESISEYAVASMQYVVGSGILKGKSASTLNPQDHTTRAEIAAVLQRFIESNK